MGVVVGMILVLVLEGAGNLNFGLMRGCAVVDGFDIMVAVFGVIFVGWIVLVGCSDAK